jgi:iron complex transport system substrate-binding protein
MTGLRRDVRDVLVALATFSVAALLHRPGLDARPAETGLSTAERPARIREAKPANLELTDLSVQAVRPSRIISLVPAITEMLFAIGAGADVIGVSSYDTYPPEALTRAKLGALVDPDFERILSLTPDLVVVYDTQTELIQRLGKVRIPIFHYQHAGLADINETVVRLGDRVGRPAEARRLADRITADLERVRTSVAKRPRPRTVLLFGREPRALRGMYASAGIGFMHDLLEVAGGDDVFADVKRQSLQVSSEVLLRRAPEVIVEVRPTGNWPPARLADERAVWQSLPSLPAVRTGRIHMLADDRLIIPGPRVAEGARLLADALHPNR